MNEKEQELFNRMKHALIGLCGGDNINDLTQMREVMLFIAAPEKEKINACNAIDTLIDVIEYEESIS